MKKINLKGNNLTKAIALLLVSCLAIGLVSSTAIKLASATYYLKYKRELKTEIPFVDNLIGIVTGNNNLITGPQTDNTDDDQPADTPADDSQSADSQTPTETPDASEPDTSTPDASTPDASTPDNGGSGEADGEGEGEGEGEGDSSGGLGDILGSLTGILGSLTGGGGSGEEESTTPTEPVTDSAETIKQKKAVLSEYSDVVNYAKKVGMPSFKKVTYRSLDKGFADGFLLHSVESAYPDYFISKENAEAAPVIVPANEKTSELLIDNQYYACMLASDKASDAIESATSVKLEDGTKKVVITLRSEANPEITPADAKKAVSYTSSMFPVLSSDIIAEKVNATLKLSSIESASVTYQNCTVELIYSPITKRIISIKQTTSYVGEVKDKVFTCKGTVTEVSEYSDFDYGII